MEIFRAWTGKALHARLNGLFYGSLEGSMLNAVQTVERHEKLHELRKSLRNWMFVIRICAFWSAEAEESTVTKKTPAALR